MNSAHTFREILRDVQRRLPVRQTVAQEAFTTTHHRPVLVKLAGVLPNTFYVFDEFTVCAFREAVLDWAAGLGPGNVTVSCGAFGEFQACRRRFEHLAGKTGKLRVLSVGVPNRFPRTSGLEVVNTHGTVLAGFTLALRESSPGCLFLCQELHTAPAGMRYLGFLTMDEEIIAELADDVDNVLRGQARTLSGFDRLKMLHQTTQRVSRELESYSRRMELAIQRARRRPDLLTPARFNRIVRQSIAKMEELKEIPRRALRSLGKSDS